MSDEATSNPPSQSVLPLLERSYKEVLDATKHQDDKIGRLFTGVSFLTAAALATANLGGSRYLSQHYVEFSFPTGVVSLASYLVLVVVCVMLLINSLATPLRVPGLSRNRVDSHVDYVGDPPLKTSQIYFAEIAKVGLGEWERKWKAEYSGLDKELVQSLVKETHNLAVRTQYKYSRTTEAIVVFNLALLFLTLTVMFCVTAATVSTESPVQLPQWSKWLLASTFGLYFFVQLQGQIRYARQTVDELAGNENQSGAILKYVWATAATAWVIILASGRSQNGAYFWISLGLLILGASALGLGTNAYARRRKELGRETPMLAWAGTIVAVLTGSILTLVARVTPAYHTAYTCAIVAASVLCFYSLILPSIAMHRSHREFADREKARECADATSATASKP